MNMTEHEHEFSVSFHITICSMLTEQKSLFIVVNDLGNSKPLYDHGNRTCGETTVSGKLDLPATLINKD